VRRESWLLDDLQVPIWLHETYDFSQFTHLQLLSISHGNIRSEIIFPPNLVTSRINFEGEYEFLFFILFQMILFIILIRDVWIPSLPSTLQDLYIYTLEVPEWKNDLIDISSKCRVHLDTTLANFRAFTPEVTSKLTSIVLSFRNWPKDY